MNQAKGKGKAIQKSRTFGGGAQAHVSLCSIRQYRLLGLHDVGKKVYVINL